MPKKPKPQTSPMSAPPPFALPQRQRVRTIHRAARGQRAVAGAASRQVLQGFEERFADIVDYIVTITDEIWIERAIGRIYETYDHACTVYTSSGIVRSVEEVVAATAATLAGFTDLTIEHLNIAWREEADGFYTSHLGCSRSTNSGPSLAGPATGKPVSFHFAADCISSHNRIHTEWLVRDTAALVRELGYDVHAVARSLPPALEIFTVVPRNRLIGQIPRRALDIGTHDMDGWVRHCFQNLWNLKRLDYLERYYSADVIVHAAGGRTAKGLRQLGDLILTVQAALPDAVMRVEHVCHSEEADGVVVAVRWILEGTSRAGKLLGDVPDGKPVFTIGMSHLKFSGGRIGEEWLLFDELALVAQALRE